MSFVAHATSLFIASFSLGSTPARNPQGKRSVGLTLYSLPPAFGRGSVEAWYYISVQVAHPLGFIVCHDTVLHRQIADHVVNAGGVFVFAFRLYVAVTNDNPKSSKRSKYACVRQVWLQKCVAVCWLSQKQARASCAGCRRLNLRLKQAEFCATLSTHGKRTGGPFRKHEGCFGLCCAYQSLCFIRHGCTNYRSRLLYGMADMKLQKLLKSIALFCRRELRPPRTDAPSTGPRSRALPAAMRENSSALDTKRVVACVTILRQKCRIFSVLRASTTNPQQQWAHRFRALYGVHRSQNVGIGRCELGR